MRPFQCAAFKMRTFVRLVRCFDKSRVLSIARSPRLCDQMTRTARCDGVDINMF